jgi:hypothetical protein
MALNRNHIHVALRRLNRDGFLLLGLDRRCGVEAGIRFGRQWRVNLVEPGEELCEEFVTFRGLCGGEVFSAKVVDIDENDIGFLRSVSDK